MSACDVRQRPIEVILPILQTFAHPRTSLDKRRILCFPSPAVLVKIHRASLQTVFPFTRGQVRRPGVLTRETDSFSECGTCG